MPHTLFSMCLLALFLFIAPAHVMGADMNSPVGLWQTIDDNTGQPKALVRLYEKDGKLFGKIEKSYKPGAESRRCAECDDERKDQPIIGLVIMRNMESTDVNEWSDGDVLDPESGSVYDATMHLQDEGKVLHLRGYIGISLLGRSQDWKRME